MILLSYCWHLNCRLGNWGCHSGRATMTACQADKRNVQREGKKLDIQREAEIRDCIILEKQRKRRLDFWLYTSPLLLLGHSAILMIIRLPQSSWYHFIKLCLGKLVLIYFCSLQLTVSEAMKRITTYFLLTLSSALPHRG